MAQMVHIKKELFLKVFEKKAGNISMACKATGVGRRTYYNWIEEDKAFREGIDDINESLIDYTESKLMQNIKACKEASIFFFLKCKAKERGYEEQRRVNLNVSEMSSLEAEIKNMMEEVGPGAVNEFINQLKNIKP